MLEDFEPLARKPIELPFVIYLVRHTDGPKFWEVGQSTAVCHTADDFIRFSQSSISDDSTLMLHQGKWFLIANKHLISFIQEVATGRLQLP